MVAVSGPEGSPVTVLVTVEPGPLVLVVPALVAAVVVLVVVVVVVVVPTPVPGPELVGLVEPSSLVSVAESPSGRSVHASRSKAGPRDPQRRMIHAIPRPRPRVNVGPARLFC